MERVDQVIGALAEGRNYLVSTVEGSLGGKYEPMRLPIFGPRHYDVEFFNVHMAHYHLDLRFVDMRWWRKEVSCEITVGVGRYADRSRSEIVYKKMECLQNNVIMTVIPKIGTADAFHAHFKGKQCGGSYEKGWVCPHKGVYLGNTPANYGVIVCPAHALRIRAATGEVL